MSIFVINLLVIPIIYVKINNLSQNASSVDASKWQCSPSPPKCNGVRMFELEPSTLSNASRTFARTCGMSRSVKTIKVVMEDLHRVIIIPCPLACRDVLVQQCDSPSHLNRIVADIGGVRVSQTWTWNRFDDEIFTHDMEVFPMCLEICIIINPWVLQVRSIQKQTRHDYTFFHLILAPHSWDSRCQENISADSEKEEKCLSWKYCIF